MGIVARFWWLRLTIGDIMLTPVDAFFIAGLLFAGFLLGCVFQLILFLVFVCCKPEKASHL